MHSNPMLFQQQSQSMPSSAISAFFMKAGGRSSSTTSDLEMMPPGGGPENEVGLDWRAAGNAAGHLRHHDRLIVAERKTCTRPIAHAIGRAAVS
jgi:hypothetical protein